MIQTHNLTQLKHLWRPIKLLNCVEIHLSTLILIIISLFLKFANILLIIYSIVIIHELAHIFTAIYLHVKLDKIEIMAFGVTMKINSGTIKNPIDEIKIAIAGPISNIVMALISLGLYNYGYIQYDIAYYLITANFAIALINLFPALPLDGGRILKATLMQSWGYVKAFNFTMIITKITTVIIIILGIVIVIISKFNFSLLLIGGFLIVNYFSEQRGSKMTMMREILFSKEKLINSGTERVGSIAIMQDEPARKALKLISYNKYYMINIIDENMNIIGTLTETQFIEGIIEKGIRCKSINLIK